MNFENDDLDSLETKPIAESTRMAASSKPTGANTDDLESLAVTFGDENLMKRDGLELCRADQDRRVRFNILQGVANPGIVNPQGAWVHYLGEGKTGATYRCLANKEDRSTCPACAKGLKRSFSLACLVVQYPQADPATGKLPPDAAPQIAIKAVRLSQANYRTISELIPEDGSVADIDLVMFKDPSRPIGYGFKAAASRLKATNMQRQAAELAKPYIGDPGALARFLGKKVTAARMKAELTDAAEPSGSLDDFDAL
jgi:hypothetical protein